MKRAIFLSILLSVGFVSLLVGQQKAANNVTYMLTFDETKLMYTVWVVPNYSTPNFNNPDSEEKGATAQVSIKVPPGFSMNEFENINGEWGGSKSKIGSEPYFKEVGLNTGMEYYIIGKTPNETNYGTFIEGEPTALFSFKGATTQPERVAVVENDDEFVSIAYNKLSLNVASSFYSKSGQIPSSQARPLEQFTQNVSINEVVEKMAEKLNATEALAMEEKDPSSTVLVYPNPSDSIVNIKYFSLEDGAEVKIELFDQSGSVLQSKDETAKRGFNSSSLDITSLSGSNYLLRTTIGGRMITKKVIKTN